MNIRIASSTRLREVVLFVGVGFSNTAVDFVALNLLILLTHHDHGWWLLPINGLSFLAAVVNSYVLNGRLTFRNSRSGDSWRFLRFVAVNAVGLVINSLIVWALSLLLNGLVGPTHRLLSVNLSKVSATAISLCWNYFAIKRWIFCREISVGACPCGPPGSLSTPISKDKSCAYSCGQPQEHCRSEGRCQISTPERPCAHPVMESETNNAI